MMRTIITLFLILFSIESVAACWAALNPQGEPVMIQATKRPRIAIARSVCAEHIKEFIPLVASEQCDSCTPQLCQENGLEVLRGDRDEDGLQDAWCVGPVEYVADQAKIAQEAAAEAARQAAAQQALTNKAAKIARVKAYCATQNGPAKELCELVVGDQLWQESRLIKTA